MLDIPPPGFDPDQGKGAMFAVVATVVFFVVLGLIGIIW